MRNNLKDTILKILEAVEYADDKEAFVKEFEELVNIQAVESLINSLPQDQKEALKIEGSANKDNSEKVSEILKSRFNEEQMQKSLEETTKSAVMEWMKTIEPTLSDQQKQNLVKLSEDLNTQASPTI